MGLGAIVFLIIGVFVIAAIFAIAQIQKEQSPENQELKEKNKQRLQEELEPLELAKVHIINTQIVDKKTFTIERYRVGISTKTKQLIIYKPIDFSTDNIFILKIPFDSIISCEILEDNETIHKGGVGRAIVGGVLAGGVGAIVGATTRKTFGVINSLKIKITLNDVVNPYYEIPLIQSQTNRSSEKYKELYQVAHEIYSTVIAIEAGKETNIDSQPKAKLPSIDNTEELRKYKKLFDDGIITQEEFEAKKKQLLGL